MKIRRLLQIRFLLFVGLFVALIGGCSRDRKELLVGRDLTWFPVQFGIYTSNINAFINDLVADINYKEDMNIEIVNQDWVHIFEDLDNRKTAGAFTSILPTSEALARYQFSDPILLTGPVLVVPESSPYQSLQDLHGKLIGVYKFDSSIQVSQNIPDAIISTYQHVPVALEALSSNCYDALLAPVIEVSALIDTAYKGRLKIVSEPLNQDGLRLITLRKDRKNLLEGFNAGLAKSIQSGKYQSLKRQNRLP